MWVIVQWYCAMVHFSVKIENCDDIWSKTMRSKQNRVFHYIIRLIKRSFCQNFFLMLYETNVSVFRSCDRSYTFIRWRTKWSIQLRFASLKGTFHLSPNENICTIALITIHYLWKIIVHRCNNLQHCIHFNIG